MEHILPPSFCGDLHSCRLQSSPPGLALLSLYSPSWCTSIQLNFSIPHDLDPRPRPAGASPCSYSWPPWRLCPHFCLFPYLWSFCLWYIFVGVLRSHYHIYILFYHSIPFSGSNKAEGLLTFLFVSWGIWKSFMPILIGMTTVSLSKFHICVLST